MNVHLWSPGFTGAANGITTLSREIALALLSLGHDLRLLGKTDAPGSWNGIPLWGSGAVPKRLQTPHFGARLLTACAVRRPDHVISMHLNFGPAAQLAKRAFRTPYTLVCHGIDVHPGLSHSRRQALRAADRVLAVSAWTRQRVLDLGEIDGTRVVVLPNTFDESRFTPASKSAALMKRYGLREDEKVVVTVGRLDSTDDYKGYDRILEALPAIQNECGAVRFVLAGHGDDRARLEGMAHDLGIQRSVTFAGFVRDDDLADHYRLADVFAMPSTGEGFGIVFLEAMGCGTPVLAGNRDGSADALDGGRLGLLVDPLDVNAIASGIIALLKRQGPDLWFERESLHEAVSRRFGRAAFREALRQALPCAA